MYNHYKLQAAEGINPAVASLPKAEMFDLQAVRLDGGVDYVPDFMGVKVTACTGQTSYVQCSSPTYKLVQHEEAFRPVIEGLTQAGVADYQFIAVSSAKKAELQIYVGGEGYDTVRLGFNVKNGFDGHTPVSYGFKAERSKKFLEIVGYRQICSNGMKIRVPLEEAEIIRPEIVTKVTTLLSEHTRILHTTNAFKKIELMQYVVEAMALLQKPVEALIKRAEGWHWNDERELKKLIKLHVGQRYASKVREQLVDEPQNLWGLYNAVTFVASHDSELKSVTRETLQDKAAELLLVAKHDEV